MTSLSKKVWDKIKKDFEPFNQTEISETLNLYNDDERERVQIYILQLAKGNKDEVYSLVESANQDYRDIIFWAENPEESQTNAAVIEQIINEFGESKK
jgi:hypothetical protein